MSVFCISSITAVFAAKARTPLIAWLVYVSFAMIFAVIPAHRSSPAVPRPDQIVQWYRQIPRDQFSGFGAGGKRPDNHLDKGYGTRSRWKIPSVRHEAAPDFGFFFFFFFMCLLLGSGTVCSKPGHMCINQGHHWQTISKRRLPRNFRRTKPVLIIAIADYIEDRSLAKGAEAEWTEPS